jgi:hypothetical protein
MVQNTFSSTSHSRKVLMIFRYREHFNRRQCRKKLDVSSNRKNSARYSFETETLRSDSSCQQQVGDVTVGLEPLLHSQTHGIWVIKSDKPKRYIETLCSKSKATHRGQTTLLCILTAIFVVPKLRCREQSRQTVFTCFRGVESTVLTYNAAFRWVNPVIAILAKGRYYICFPSDGVSWFYKVVPTELRDSVLNWREQIYCHTVTLTHYSPNQLNKPTHEKNQNATPSELKWQNPNLLK